MVNYNFPKIFRIHQKIPAPIIEDIISVTRSELKKLNLERAIRPGHKVGITAGSRGISNIPLILKTISEFIKQYGAKSYLIPSMGTHGGAKAEEQIKILSDLGITPNNCKTEIIPCVETVLLGHTSSGYPVYANKAATEVDHLLVVNRIKQHTDFTGETESGIIKMMAIGLGSYRGATTAHSFALYNGHVKVFQEIAQVMLAKLPLIGALGIIENWQGKTAYINSICTVDIFKKEKQLLQKAKELKGKLPFKEIDVLVIEEIGKEISGTGMDTKVVGRIMILGQDEPKEPKIGRIVVLDLTKGSHGNAIGIGLSDITTKRFVSKIDYKVTKINCIGSLCPEQGRTPLAEDTDIEAIISGINSSGHLDPQKCRVLHIKNTLALEEMEASEAYWNEAKENPNIEIVSDLHDINFRSNGSIVKLYE